MIRYFPRPLAHHRAGERGTHRPVVDARRAGRSRATGGLRMLAGAAAAVALLGVGGCSGTDAPPPASAEASSPASGTAGGAAVFGGTDRAWIEINIAMDEELLPLLALVPERGGAGVKELSAEVSSFHEQELTVLRALHDQAQLPAENPHKGMPMPGMVTPEQVTAAGKVRGAAFDALVTEQLRAHLEQGVSLAESERKAGVEPQTKALAEKVIESRRTYLARLGELG
ncbi:DUF305 domain-containing protein [Actinoplanes sp. RD1]|uniref:DUF305 domain-containing protein n=1 Tax=Actinoplanes sp. RD1 TaxID=3064538 RepID=UPI002740E1F8|nr:DUF305 domain-containing protein [Actinoplanes sp. RD1]